MPPKGKKNASNKQQEPDDGSSGGSSRSSNCNLQSITMPPKGKKKAPNKKQAQDDGSSSGSSRTSTRLAELRADDSSAAGSQSSGRRSTLRGAKQADDSSATAANRRSSRKAKPSTKKAEADSSPTGNSKPSCTSKAKVPAKKAASSAKKAPSNTPPASKAASPAAVAPSNTTAPKPPSTPANPVRSGQTIHQSNNSKASTPGHAKSPAQSFTYAANNGGRKNGVGIHPSMIPYICVAYETEGSLVFGSPDCNHSDFENFTHLQLVYNMLGNPRGSRKVLHDATFGNDMIWFLAFLGEVSVSGEIKKRIVFFFSSLLIFMLSSLHPGSTVSIREATLIHRYVDSFHWTLFSSAPLSKKKYKLFFFIL